MPKKKSEPTGILSIDPSWRGTGYAIYLPEQNYIKTGCVDLVDKFSNRKKLYDNPDCSRDLVYAFLSWLFTEEAPECKELINVVVLERQFKQKMQNLYHCYSNQLRCFLGGKTKIIGIASWNTKTHFGTATGTYAGNKREAIAFLERNSDLIGCELHFKNDNIADAIILLNHLIQKKYTTLMSRRPTNNRVVHRPTTHQDDAPFTCQECNYPCIVKQSGPNSKRPGADYYACVNKSNCSKGSSGGFNQYVDTIDVTESTSYAPKHPVGAKRQYESDSEPQAKRLYAPDDNSDAETKAYHKAVVEILKQLLAQTQQINAGVAQTITSTEDVYNAICYGKPTEEEQEAQKQ